tara:strand:- start:5118 stop:5252 length:135 start_codon:yes stop_codon:yes gene_type:complete
MERAFNARLRYWRVRPDETIGSLAHGFFLIARFCVVGFVKISDV